SMEEQAAHLAEAVSLFRLDAHDAPTASAKVAPVVVASAAPAAPVANTPQPRPRAPARVAVAEAVDSDWQEF
ncbi:hypothetical protein ACO0J1_06600, partial [Stenotrophomonas acidaminiphila]